MKNTETAPGEPRAPRSRGRPRSFDRKHALAAAAEAFWRLGYEGASIVELTGVMKITPQSLYAAFHSKSDLYREAILWYRDEIGYLTQEALADPDVLRAFERMLEVCAREFCLPGRPRGCMISTALVACAPESSAEADLVAEYRAGTIRLFRERLLQGIVEGQLRPDTDTESFARYYGALLQGFTVQARDGASEAELLAVARIAGAELSRHRAAPQP